MKKGISFDYSLATDFLPVPRLTKMEGQIYKAHEQLLHGTGKGGESTGWVDWPMTVDHEEIQRIKEISEKIREKADIFIVIGVGGSYLGARSAIEWLKPYFYNESSKDSPQIYFLGHQMSSAYMAQLLQLIKGKEVYINVVSKSGGTLETAIAFRVLKQFIEDQVGKEEAKNRILVTTDCTKGKLNEIAKKEGYERFHIPSTIGGRYSVLTPVGLLPMAVANIDIDSILDGARKAYFLYQEPKLWNNPCYQYAAMRNLFYEQGKNIELMANYEPSFFHIAEWWKQLFGESEGKEGKGILPVNVNFTTDLHSLGQYIQEGRRDLFATTLWVDKSVEDFQVPWSQEDMDGLNDLSGLSMHFINEKAFEGVVKAHTYGQVPNLIIRIPEISPYYYGMLVYFFEKACAMSGYVLGVNPFNQPGVEEYKRNMMDLLKGSREHQGVTSNL